MFFHKQRLICNVEIFCILCVAEAMMKMNMTKEEKMMMEMERWNMSQLYKRSLPGKF